MAKSCKGYGPNGKLVRRFLDKGDAKSTSNLHKHAVRCWGKDIIASSVGSTVAAVREGINKQSGGQSLLTFKTKTKGAEIYLPRPMNKVEMR